MLGVGLGLEGWLFGEGVGMCMVDRLLWVGMVDWLQGEGVGTVDWLLGEGIVDQLLGGVGLGMG